MGQGKGRLCSALFCFNKALLLLAGWFHLRVCRVVSVVSELHSRPVVWSPLGTRTKMHEKLIVFN